MLPWISKQAHRLTSDPEGGLETALLRFRSHKRDIKKKFDEARGQTNGEKVPIRFDL
jgi:hypothetical protein